MSEENATPEVPATEPVVEVPVAAEVAVSEETPVAAEPLTPVQSIEALSTEVLATLHDVFQYIHEGFDQHSLMIGMSRLYEIARAVKAKLEA